MNTCWKCGEPVADHLRECDPICGEQIEAAEPPPEKLVELDWSKVKTTEDLIQIMTTYFGGMVVVKDSPAYQTLKKFLKE